MVSQYQRVINPPAVALERLKSGWEEEELKEGEKGGNLKPKVGPGRGGPRMQILEASKKRSEWEKWIREKRKKKESEEEEQKGELGREIDESVEMGEGFEVEIVFKASEGNEKETTCSRGLAGELEVWTEKEFLNLK